eukprot:4822102-Prymnesium_polylepis.1
MLRETPGQRAKPASSTIGSGVYSPSCHFLMTTLPLPSYLRPSALNRRRFFFDGCESCSSCLSCSATCSRISFIELQIQPMRNTNAIRMSGTMPCSSRRPV